MRVLWISAALFVAFIIIGFVVYDHDDNLVENSGTSDSSTSSVPAPEDPFASDEGSDTEITLAQLPASEQEQEAVGGIEQVEATVDTTTLEGGISNELAELEKEIQAQNTVAPESAKPEKVEDGAKNSATIVEVTEVSVSNPATEQREDLTELRKKYLANNKQKDIIAVIVHENNNEKITKTDVMNMYLEKLTHWRNGNKIKLYNLPLGDKSRERFSIKILKMSSLVADQLEAQREEDNTSVNPATVKAKNIIVSYVERDPNAIAYVPVSAIRSSANVKVVFTIQ